MSCSFPSPVLTAGGEKKDIFLKQTMVDDKAIIIHITDTAGKEEYVSIRNRVMYEMEGFILLYSITSTPSFETAKKLHTELVKVKDSTRFPLVLVGNKCDLETDREISEEEGRKAARSMNNCKMFETSAKTGQNIEQAFYDVVREIIKYQTLDSMQNSSSGASSTKRKQCLIL